MNFRVSRPESEESMINLTPLIDMVFLLLIFFMLTTNLAVTSGFDVNLPKSGAHRGSVDEAKNLVVYLSQDGKAYIDGKQVSDNEVLEKARTSAKSNKDGVIIIRADTNASHGAVVRIMDLAKSGGIKRLAIDTKMKPKKGEDIP